MAQRTRGSMENPLPPKVSPARMRWWVALAALATVLVAARLVTQLPAFSPSPYAKYAKGELTKLSFKFAGQPAPQIAFTAPDGKPTSLAAFKGKPLLMNLWATWCQPCITELPSLDALQAVMGGEKFQVVAISMDADDLDTPHAFLAEHKLSHLPQYSDTKLLMEPALAGPGIPASVLYDASGHEIARAYGPVDWASAEARALIGALVNSPR